MRYIPHPITTHPRAPLIPCTAELCGARHQRWRAYASLSQRPIYREADLVVLCDDIRQQNSRNLLPQYLLGRRDSWPCHTEINKFDSFIFEPNSTDHSVPRKVTPAGEWRKTSRPLIRTSVPGSEIRRFPARICKSVDFPAKYGTSQIAQSKDAYQAVANLHWHL